MAPVCVLAVIYTELMGCRAVLFPLYRCIYAGIFEKISQKAKSISCPVLMIASAMHTEFSL